MACLYSYYMWLKFLPLNQKFSHCRSPKMMLVRETLYLNQHWSVYLPVCTSWLVQEVLVIEHTMKYCLGSTRDDSSLLLHSTFNCVTLPYLLNISCCNSRHQLWSVMVELTCPSLAICNDAAIVSLQHWYYYVFYTWLIHYLLCSTTVIR